MTSFVKDPENAATPAAPAAPARPQPVALEVPVIVNGARAMDGTDKREPFSERSQTVLVFGHGAVIRVSAALAPGQLIFLTNEKTKKEVVCQVVKSKSDGGSVGYVELRFTEPAPGFWGMRFPADTVLPQAVARPAGAPVVPPAPKTAPPASPESPVAPWATAPPTAPPALKPVSSTPPIAAKPVAPPPPAPATLSEEPLRSLLSARPSFAANAYPLPQEPVAAATGSLPVAEVKPVFSTPAASSNPTTEELKQQAARLQEQLSSLLFTDPAKPASADPLAGSASQSSVNLAESAKALFDATAPAKEFVPGANLPQSAAPSSKSASPSLPVEELQIPAWLAPLAREADSSSSPTATASSLPAVPEAPVEVAAESVLPALEEPEVLEALAEPVEPMRRPETAVFGGQLLGEASADVEAPASKSRTGLFLGIAAALLLVAGGFWYSQQPGNAISGMTGGSTSSAPSAAAKKETSAASSPALLSRSTSFASSPATAAANPPAETTPTAAPEVGTPAPTFSHNSNFTSTPMLHSAPAAPVARAANSAPAPAPAAGNPAPVVEQPKKPALGEVRMAAPKVHGGKNVNAPGDAEPSIDVNPAGNFSAPVSAISTSHRAEPTAPVPVGGDVKPAKLIKSVPPVYPDIARTQHLSGSVQIDASIGADGNVGAMKVLSGPTLLHQAAMTAVKQWKFQPAELDGKPTAMHLTVTVQFRAQ